MTTKETLIQNLNEDLAAEYGKIIRYTYQSGKAFGLKSVELRELFADDISDGLKHASFLNDVIVDLGGEPVTEPTRFDKPDVLRIMLAVDEVLEFRNEENYMAHAELAGELGYNELRLKLEEMAAYEAGHARNFRRILRGL